jgi:hypothetical protein
MRGETKRAGSAPRRRCRVSRPSARGRRLRNVGGRRRITRVEAEKRAAQARREEAQAQEQVAAAEGRRREARERRIEAARMDPDADEDEVAERLDRERRSDRPEGDRGR